MEESSYFSEESSVSKERVIHDERQVRSVEELVVGKKYLKQSKCGYKAPFELISITPETNHALIRPDGYRNNVPTSLADCGIVPYYNGTWNKFNYVIPVENSN